MASSVLAGVKKITVYDMQKDKEVAVITADTVTTASEDIVVKLSMGD